MKRKTDEITLADYRRLTAKQPRRAKKPPRADIPRAETQERDGLTTLIRAGWCVQTPDCVRYRLYVPGGADTGLCASAKAACDKAKELSK